MKRLIWELRYDRAVTAFLYSLRETKAGPIIHQAIKDLQFEEDPAKGREQVPDRPGRCEFTVSNHIVGFQFEEETDRKVIIVAYIKANE